MRTSMNWALPVLFLIIAFQAGAQDYSNLPNGNSGWEFNFGLKVQTLNVSVVENPLFLEMVDYYYSEDFFTEIQGVPPGKELSNLPYLMGIQLLDMKLRNWPLNRVTLGFDVMNYKYRTSLYGLNVGVGREGPLVGKLSYQGMANIRIGIEESVDDMQYYSCYTSGSHTECVAFMNGEQNIFTSSPSLLELSFGLNYKLGTKRFSPMISVFGGYAFVMNEFTFGRDIANPNLPSPPAGYIWVGPGSTTTEIIDPEYLRYNIEVRNQAFFGIAAYFNFAL